MASRARDDGQREAADADEQHSVTPIFSPIVGLNQRRESAIGVRLQDAAKAAQVRLRMLALCKRGTLLTWWASLG
jgi:hypothetical protein